MGLKELNDDDYSDRGDSGSWSDEENDYYYLKRKEDKLANFIIKDYTQVCEQVL